MRKLYWTFAMLALPFIAAHACGGDDTMPGGSAGTRTTDATSSGSGSGGASTGATTSTTSSSTTSGGSAGR